MIRINRKMVSLCRQQLQFVSRLMMSQYVASLDQSTTSTKFSIFKTNGQLIAKQIIEHRQITPNQGWLEHDPQEIITNANLSMQRVITKLTTDRSIDPDFSVSKIQGLGICNQRQTIVCWDKTGKPLHNAIVWCDSRTKGICEDFANKYGDFKMLTGLPVSPYFSLFKIIWLLELVPGLKEKLVQGKIKFGTIDSWLVYNLTGKYVTDASNASRTYLCNLNGQWDQALLKLFKINQNSLPQIIGSFQQAGQIQNGPLKGISVCSIMGDQQSSAYAHGLKIKQMKITYGTGCFLMSNIGNQPEIHDSFVTTILNKRDQEIQYAYEASVECGGGTLNWAKRAGFFNSYNELNNLPRMTNQQLFFYPSFGSIFAPFWKSGVKGCFTGFDLSTSKDNILQAILQSITFRLNDNIKQKEFNDVKQIFVDGGMCANKSFMQLQSDTFNKNVHVRELDTCWGVAKGVLINKNIQVEAMKEKAQHFTPNLERHKELMERYGRWQQERAKLYNWKGE